MADKIPSRSRNEETLSVFPAAENDVPAPPADELNAHAWEIAAEGDYAPKYPKPGATEPV